MSQLADTIRGILQIAEGRVTVIVPSQVPGVLMDRLTQTALLHPRHEMRAMSRWIIKQVTPQCGLIPPEMPTSYAPSFSLREEMAFAQGEGGPTGVGANTGVRRAGHG